MVMSIQRLESMHDVERAMRLGEMMHSEGVYAFLPFAHDKVRRLGAAILADKEEQVYFARLCLQDNEPIGVMVAYVSEYFFSQYRIVQDMVLYVHPDYRQGRAALRLMRAFMSWAQRVGASEECLGITVGVNNEAAARLYEHLGYERVGYLYKRRTL